MFHIYTRSRSLKVTITTATSDDWVDVNKENDWVEVRDDYSGVRLAVMGLLATMVCRAAMVDAADTMAYGRERWLRE
ncbi:hypothetical protein RIF29_25653 [Crotalaria pallida]|uniref:Uncharacterized protein n=1 Tax=Crotalaria pallida TaxID=3830 RepID=A0AAN9HZF8_CROPI